MANLGVEGVFTVIVKGVKTGKGGFWILQQTRENGSSGCGIVAMAVDWGQWITVSENFDPVKLSTTMATEVVCAYILARVHGPSGQK